MARVTLQEWKRIAERIYLLGVLRETKGNVAAAARLAGVNRTDFYKRMERCGVVTKRKKRKRSIRISDRPV